YHTVGAEHLFGQRHDGYGFAITRSLDGKVHVAIDAGIQGVVLAHADIFAGMEVCATLPDDDGAGIDLLAAKTLDAKPFGMGIASVATAAACLFMCHLLLPLVRCRSRLRRRGST